MSDSPGGRVQDVRLRLTWDDDADAGCLYLADSGDGDAVPQRVIENPVPGLGDVVLSFDREGGLPGIELVDRRLLPPGLETRR